MARAVRIAALLVLQGCASSRVPTPARGNSDVPRLFYVGGKRVDVVWSDRSDACNVAGTPRPDLIAPIADAIRARKGLRPEYRRPQQRIVLFDYESRDDGQWVFGARPTIGIDPRTQAGVVVINMGSAGQNMGTAGVDFYCLRVVEASEITVTMWLFEKMRS